ncbi:MAG: MarR family EPS-associated transcriptional regulator [Deltaproteobacteria bacterium]|nr:MarR family EPS-associated transcriptional regulator [Deltaproteobacteria bacterium]MBW2593246.1 MarR family EPS-associated transcriptional regulator [Deltaproteobacteria bacterium]
MNALKQREIHYRLLKILAKKPEMSQREMAKRVGVSLGKVNFLISELTGKGILKAKQFKNSRNKAGYAYILTPHGLEEKTKLALGYLQSKITEYETIRCQIVDLERELESDKTVLFSKHRTSELPDGIA